MKYHNRGSYIFFFIVLFFTLYIIFKMEIKIFRYKINNKIFKSEKFEKEIIIKNCNCTNSITAKSIENLSAFKHYGISEAFVSACSSMSDHRGFGQNIISFSLFKNNREKTSNYIKGLEKILQTLPNFYSDSDKWIVRIYSDLEMDDHLCQKLICNYSYLDWCDINEFSDYIRNMKTKTTWRFFPIGDPLVNKFVSRDLDSVFSIRERIAVKEWENSNKIFHLMRDHPYHSADILAGMWGAKNMLFGLQNGLRIRKNIIKNANEEYKEKDQNILAEVLYKPYKNLFLQHDSFHCVKYSNTTPWPIQRKNSDDFVGNPIFRYKIQITEKCPVECRPEKNKDWEYC